MQTDPVVDYRQLSYKGLLYLQYLDTRDFFSILYPFVPMILVRIVIKHPGINSYQIERKKNTLRVSLSTYKQQWQVHHNHGNRQPCCYYKAGFQNAQRNTAPCLMLSTCLCNTHYLQCLFWGHIKETESSKPSVWDL